MCMCVHVYMYACLCVRMSMCVYVYVFANLCVLVLSSACMNYTNILWNLSSCFKYTIRSLAAMVLRTGLDDQIAYLKSLLRSLLTKIMIICWKQADKRIKSKNTDLY